MKNKQYAAFPPAAQTPAPAAGNIITLPPRREAAPVQPVTQGLLAYDPRGIPQALREHPHWLVSNIKGKPVARPGVGNSKTCPGDWVNFATASRIAENEPGHWPYLVLTDESQFTILDVDFKPRRETGKEAETVSQYETRIQRAQRALERLREMFPVRYESRSKSGLGWHIVLLGKFVGSGGQGKGDWADVEIYTQGHGIALTGHVSEGHDNFATYPAETLQNIRDAIKGSHPTQDSEGDISDRRSNGSVPVEFARKVLAEIRSKEDNPQYPDWVRLASPVFDGVGVEAGIELMEEFWPEIEPGEYARLAKSFAFFKPWGTLNEWLKGASIHAEDWMLEASYCMPKLPDDDEAAAVMSAGPLAFPIIRAGDIEGAVEQLDFVEGLLTEGGASVIYGPSNCGKSFWVLDLGTAVATGKPFRGNLEVDQGAVIYVALEGSRGARNRIDALERAGMMPANAPFFLCFAAVSLLDQRHIAKLTASVKQAAAESGFPCRLVILDTLARAMAGGDENSGKDMGAAVKTMDAIRAATGAHVMLVHHCGKDEARGARGHSSLRAAVDTEIEISRPEGETISTVRATKQRDLSAGDAMPFSLKTVTLGTDRRGKPITSCVVHPEDKMMASKPGKSGRPAKCTAEDMLRYLPADTITAWQKRVEEETGLKETGFYEAKKKLEKFRKIRREPGTNRILRNDPCDAMPVLSE